MIVYKHSGLTGLKNGYLYHSISGIWNSRPVPGDLMYYFALPVQQIGSVIGGVGFVLNNWPLFLISTGFLGVWFFIMFHTGTPVANKLLSSRINGIKKAAGIVFIVLVAVGLCEVITVISSHSLTADTSSDAFRQVLSEFSNGFSYNDSTALTAQAVNNLLAGRNPYENSNVVTALAKYNQSSDRLTPLRTGVFAKVFPYPTLQQLKDAWQVAIQKPSQPAPEFAGTYCYPAGDFLLPVPFFLIGITDLRLIYLILTLLAIGYVIYLLPSRKRYLFIGAAIISLELWTSIANGDTGALVFPFLLLAWVLIRKNIWFSAVCMGIAVATKQTAWFFLPFYLIAVFKTTGVKKAGYVAAIMASIFLAANLPFAMRDYGSWLTSIITPMSNNMFPVGVGVVSLVTNGIINVNSPFIFDIVEFMVLGCGIIWYLFYFKRYPQLGPVLAIFPIFFAWRSLFGYFFYTGLIVLAMVLSENKDLYGSLESQSINSCYNKAQLSTDTETTAYERNTGKNNRLDAL